MLVAKKTITSYLDIIHRHPKLVKNSLVNRAIELLDIIELRLNKEGIKEVSKGLYASLFDMRIEFVQSINYEEFEETVREPILDVSDELRILTTNYQRIVLSVIDELPKDKKEIFSQFDNISLSYHTLLLIEPYIKNFAPKFIYLKNLVDESLNIDLGLVAIQTSIDRDLKFSKERIKNEFLPFVETSIMNFGKAAILCGLWNPTTEQLNIPFLNSIKLRTSIEQINQSKVAPVTIDQLQQMTTI